MSASFNLRKKREFYDPELPEREFVSWQFGVFDEVAKLSLTLLINDNI